MILARPKFVLIWIQLCTLVPQTKTTNVTCPDGKLCYYTWQTIKECKRPLDPWDGCICDGLV